jgi:hypothetical protein
MSPALEDLDGVDDTPAIQALFSNLKSAVPALKSSWTNVATVGDTKIRCTGSTTRALRFTRSEMPPSGSFPRYRTSRRISN